MFRGTSRPRHPVSFRHLDLVEDEKTCRICGQPLLGDVEDQPFPPLGPMCGECYRSQQMDDELEMGGSLDGDEESDF
jgi:hypothetical protein